LRLAVCFKTARRARVAAQHFAHKRNNQRKS